jgi:acyl carrier protein
MKREDILKTLSDIIDDKIGLMDELEEHNHFRNDLGFDSLDDIEVIMSCETEFDITINESHEEVQQIETVKQALDYLESIIN